MSHHEHDDWALMDIQTAKMPLFDFYHNCNFLSNDLAFHDTYISSFTDTNEEYINVIGNPLMKSAKL